MLMTMPPMNAAPKPEMAMPAPSRLTDSEPASSSMRLLMTSWKIPSVRMVTGSEITLRIGFTSEFTRPRNRPVKAKHTHASAGPNGSMPGTT